MKSAPVFSRWVKFLAIFTVTSALALACAVSGKQPTISPDMVATVVAMTLQAVTPLAPATAEATTVPPTAMTLPATATPAAAPTIRAPSGARVSFATGATAGVVRGKIRPGQVLDFLVGASAGQPMIITVDSPNHDVTFSLTGQKDGIVLLPPSEKSSSWQNMLTETQDYLVEVAGGASAGDFTLNIITPARITFDPGAVSAQRSGWTPGGLDVSYVLRANAGQKMKLQLDAPVGANLVLGVYGYQDGQPYLRSVVESMSFEMTLPATQDYIIQVIPRDGKGAGYHLNVQVK